MKYNKINEMKQNKKKNKNIRIKVKVIMRRTAS